MATLSSVTSATSGTAPTTWADVPDLSLVVNVGSAASILIFLASVNVDIGGSGSDKVADFRFADGGTRTGPYMSTYIDLADVVGNCSIAHVESGFSAGNHTFSLMWQDRQNAPPLDTGRTRMFQVIQLTAAEATHLVDITSTTADVAPATYADIDQLTGSPTVGSADSVVLFLGTVPILAAADNTADYRFADGGTREGPEMTLGYADADPDDVGWGTMYWAKTGISGSKTFSMQWQDRNQTSDTDTGRERTFHVVELKDAAIMVDVTSVTSDTAPATWADIDGFSGSGTPQNTDSLVVFLENLSPLAAAGDETADVRFTDGGTPEATVTTVVHRDANNDVLASGLPFTKTGISGSHTFAAQWQQRLATSETDTGRTRSFQMLDIKAPAAADGELLQIPHHMRGGFNPMHGGFSA